MMRFFTLEPIKTPGAAARMYVPMVMASRGLALVRTYLVARLLGRQDYQFGLYQLALELANPLVAIVMFGAADAAERYVSRIERLEGHAGVVRFLRRQYLRLGGAGLGIAVILVAAGPWISRAVWGETEIPLVAACAVAIFFLAFYQHLAGVLRGLRGYAAAAGMEIFSAGLLVIFSGFAALSGKALWLMAAYALSVFVPLLVYGFLLWKYLKQSPADANQEHRESPASADPLPAISRFAAWAFVRMLLVMVFGGFFSLWGVRFLDQHAVGTAATSEQAALAATGQFSWPFRMAQLIGFLAVALWASSYGIAARAWSHGQMKRATVQYFRVGRLGMAGLCVLAVLLLWMRGIFAWILPQYAESISVLLPGLLAVFIGYALAAFFSGLADLREKPERGAAIWATAVFVQGAGIVFGRFGGISRVGVDAGMWMVVICALALAAALGIAVPLLLCRPMRFSATGVPPVVLGVAAITFFAPGWVVDWIAGLGMLGAVALLYSMGLLVRPMDRRAFRRWRAQRARDGILAGPIESIKE